MSDEEKHPELLFHVATEHDWPKAKVHRSTVLASRGHDMSGDPFWAWVTAAKRKNQGLHLLFYIGGQTVSGLVNIEGIWCNNRECADAATVYSWEEARAWLTTLSDIRVQVNYQSEEEFDALDAPFRVLRPAWFTSSPAR